MDEKFTLEVIERLTRVEEISKKTLEQCVRTNGRVGTLEEKVDSLESTRDQNTGGWKLATTVSTVVSSVIALGFGYLSLKK